MDETQKRDVATFRFGVIHDLVGGAVLGPGEKERLIREKCARKWSIPYSDKTRLTRTTILRWVRLYQASGRKLEALYPRERNDQGRSRAMDADTSAALMRLRHEMPRATVKTVIKEMNDRGLAGPELTLTPSTVYRFLNAKGVMAPAGCRVDRRKFEAEHPNDLWQSDVMHGPLVKQQGKNRKAYLIAFIDDHSRLVPHAEFYGAENLDTFQKALQMALTTRGIPRKLYVDNGPAFRSKHLEHICASLGIALIHSRPYQPQGRGKIERFFKTCRTEFLPGFKGLSLYDLNLAFNAWLENVYHRRPHGGTGQTPWARFTDQISRLQPVPDDLADHFRKVARRKVAKDRTISLNGKLYEAPVQLIGTQVTLLYHEDDLEQIEIKLGAKSYGLIKTIDLHVNCRVKRTRNRDLEISEAPPKNHYQGGSLWGKGTSS